MKPLSIGRCGGTFGELLQGQLPDTLGQFLVTLPISKGATVGFQHDPNSTSALSFVN